MKVIKVSVPTFRILDMSEEDVKSLAFLLNACIGNWRNVQLQGEHLDRMVRLRDAIEDSYAEQDDDL